MSWRRASRLSSPIYPQKFSGSCETKVVSFGRRPIVGIWDSVGSIPVLVQEILGFTQFYYFHIYVLIKLQQNDCDTLPRHRVVSCTRRYLHAKQISSSRVGQIGWAGNRNFAHQRWKLTYNSDTGYVNPTCVARPESWCANPDTRFARKEHGT